MARMTENPVEPEENYSFRPTVWLLAVVDIILSCIGLGWTFLFFAVITLSPDLLTEEVFRKAGIKRQGDADEKTQMKTEQMAKQMHLVMLIVIAIQMIAYFLQTIAAIKLLNATKPERETNEALKQCQFWRRVTLFFTILLVMNLLFNPTRPWFGYLFLVGNFFLRVVGLHYVRQFMRELNVTPSIHDVEANFGQVISSTHHIAAGAVHPHPYYPSYVGYPPMMHAHVQVLDQKSMDLPPSYDDVIKDIRKENNPTNNTNIPK